MRLLVNTSSVYKGGSVQVAASIISELRTNNDHTFGVILGPGMKDLVRSQDFPENFTFFGLDYRPAQRLKTLRIPHIDLARIESRFRPDVVFTTSGPSYWRPNAPHLMGFNLAHGLYPDSPYFSHMIRWHRRVYWWLKSRFVRYLTREFADAWVVQTDDIRDRLRSWIGSDHIHTVSNTISQAYLDFQRQSQIEGVIRDADRTDFQVLVLSSYYPHKNLEIVDKIASLLRKDGVSGIDFLMTLPDADYKRVISAKNRRIVRNAGPQAPDQCPNLYQRSCAVFAPSLLECFSATYVEAMAMRRPIVASDLGFARSVCGTAAMYFDPLKAEDALEKLMILKRDPDLYRELVEAGSIEIQRFGSASDRARRYLDLCGKLATGANSRC